MTIDMAIAQLERLRSEVPGTTALVFSDGSPVRLVLSVNKELSPDRYNRPVVQVRLDRSRLQLQQTV